MNLVDKFEIGKETHTYRRLNEQFKVNFFVGYNEEGMMSLVITEYGKYEKTKSTRTIQVLMKNREDGKIALSFELLDDKYRTLFLVFCQDIIESCEYVGKEKAITYGIERWKFWKDMFGKKNCSILAESEIKGLIGELLFIKDYVWNKENEERAITSWMGPLYGHKDFEIKDTWYEVKTVNENAIQVSISSIEQLESTRDGHLVIIKLTKTNSIVNDSNNLNQLVADISKNIRDIDILYLFKHKLLNVGYQYSEEYDEYNYLYKGMSIYNIHAKFPRIRREDLSGAIGGVNYTIMLNAIEIFKEV